MPPMNISLTARLQMKRLVAVLISLFLRMTMTTQAFPSTDKMRVVLARAMYVVSPVLNTAMASMGFLEKRKYSAIVHLQ